MKFARKDNLIFVSILTVLFILVYSYIFNPKIDLNGDNCDYYMGATSIAQGHGYSNISVVSPDGYPPINTFPIGYPLIMATVRVFTDSILAQKLLNGIFYILSVIFLYFLMVKLGISKVLAFIIGVLIIMNERLLHFSTMMMSEMSFLFTSVSAIFYIYKMQESKKFFLKSVWFYWSLVAIVLNYHIRTQGITLIAAVILFFIIKRDWRKTLGYIIGFGIGCVPYMLRNKIQGLGQSRYLDTIAIANPWRPEEGSLTFGEVIKRFFETLGMLISKATPNSIFPFKDVDYNAPATVEMWAIGIGLIAIIIIGYCKLKDYKWIFIFYSIFTFGIISIFSTPSGNRYITTVLPIFTMGLGLGIYSIIIFLCEKAKITTKFAPYCLILLIIPAIKPIHTLKAVNRQPFPPNYVNFFEIGNQIRKQLPPTTKVASRKPSLLYMYSRTPVCGYPYTKDTKAFLAGLLKSKADYVILDQLGYSSSSLYLLPAIQAYPEVFKLVGHLPNPDTYLFYIDRAKAQEIIDKK